MSTVALIMWKDRNESEKSPMLWQQREEVYSQEVVIKSSRHEHVSRKQEEMHQRGGT